MKPDSHTLERLVPDEIVSGDATGSDTLRLHLERYAFAVRHAQPGRILDAACGTGYGTRFVADRLPGSHALGVDISEEAVEYARTRYGCPGVDYMRADAARFSDPLGFDTIISLETIEHVPAPERLVAQLVSLLRPGGVFVGSVPTTPSVDANPHHLHDFTERSFRRMLSAHRLEEVDCLQQVQPYHPLPLLKKTEARARDIRPNLGRYYAEHPGALLRRLWSTMVDGFCNRYLTLAMRKLPGG